QVSQIVFRVFRWRDGHYNFAATDSVDFDRENFTPMSADFILMEGIRMVDEWPIIEKKIPSMDIVFPTVLDPSMIEVPPAEAAAPQQRDKAPPLPGRGADLPQGGRHAHRERHYRRDRPRRVRGLPHPVRPPEPQHHRAHGTRDDADRPGRGTRGHRLRDARL